MDDQIGLGGCDEMLRIEVILAAGSDHLLKFPAVLDIFFECNKCFSDVESVNLDRQHINWKFLSGTERDL